MFATYISLNTPGRLAMGTAASVSRTDLRAFCKEVVNLLVETEKTHGEFLHFCDCGRKLLKPTVCKTAGKCSSRGEDKMGLAFEDKCSQELVIGKDQVATCDGCDKFYCLPCLQARREEEVGFTQI